MSCQPVTGFCLLLKSVCCQNPRNFSRKTKPTMPTVQLLIKGKVQGVFFRASAREMAQTLDLQGWVKNTANGDVEITATGSDAHLQQFVEWCKQGPEAATVASVGVTESEEKTFDDFRIVKE